MDEKMMNKLDDMEMELDDMEMELDNMELDTVAGGFRPNLIFRPIPRKHDANSMAANVDETQNASACVR